MDLRASIVRVLSADGSTAGTGFFCQPPGYVVTCSHVVDGNVHADGYLRLHFLPRDEGQPVELRAKVCREWCSPTNEQDFAILELADALPRYAVALELSRGKPRVGAMVDTRGYPVQNVIYGMPGQAKFVGITQDINSGAEVYVVCDNSVARGFSGAPCVLRESGEVLGIVSAVTTADLEGRWAAGAFITPADAILDGCPVLTAGTLPLVKSLVTQWQEDWEPFQKYATWSFIESNGSGGYEFPVLEHRTDTGIQYVEPLSFIGDQLESTEPKALVIVGAPGVGKSRLMAEVARAVCAKDLLGSSRHKVVPVLVSARSFAAARGTFVAEHIAEGVQLDGVWSTLKVLRAEAIDELLLDDRYRLLLLIDGADEIGDRVARKQMFMRFAADGLALLKAGHLAVLSTRPLDEAESPALRKMSLCYELPTLGTESSLVALAKRTLGDDRAADFERVAISTGLISLLDTPLLFNLAASLFLRRSSDFPRTILGLYEQYLKLLQESWEVTPVDTFEMVDVFGGVALGSLEVPDRRDSLAVWVDEIDDAIHDAFGETLRDAKASPQAALRTAQAIINFGLRASGLMHQQGQELRWSHLLVRDYLAALKLRSMSHQGTGELQKILGARSADPLWRESLILFVVLESLKGRAEQRLRFIHDGRGGYDYPLILFIKDCIYRGAKLDSEFLAQYFKAFEMRALEDQHSFGSCRKVFIGDYGAFWHLLHLQRIPQAQDAIQQVISKADRDSMVSEWPDSERAKIFTPASLYNGPLATAGIFRRTSGGVDEAI
jgi:hypothetical protein